MADDVETLLLGDLSNCERAVGLERVGDVHVITLLVAEGWTVDLPDTSLDGTAVDDDRRAVVTGSGDHATGHVLVATEGS